MMDDLVKKEEEKQWKLREAQWRKEDEAKLQLLREVYESRATHIEHMKRLQSEQKESVRRDMDDLANQLHQQETQHAERTAAQQIARQQQQSDVLMQIGEKERMKKKQYQEEMYEQRAMKLAEIAYKKKIDGEKQNNEMLLTKMKTSQGPFY